MRPLRYSINVTLEGTPCSSSSGSRGGLFVGLFAGLPKHRDLQLVSRLEVSSGVVAMQYVPRGIRTS